MTGISHQEGLPSVAEKVRDALKDRPFLISALAQGIVNYSALARIIKDDIGGSASTDAIKVALLREARTMKDNSEINKQRVTKVLKNSRLSLQDKVAVLISKNPLKIPNLVLKLNKIGVWRIVGFEPNEYGSGNSRFYAKVDLSETPAVLSDYNMRELWIAAQKSMLVKLGIAGAALEAQGMVPKGIANALESVDWSTHYGSKIVWDPSTKPGDRTFYLMLRDLVDR